MKISITVPNGYDFPNWTIYAFVFTSEKEKSSWSKRRETQKKGKVSSSSVLILILMTMLLIWLSERKKTMMKNDYNVKHKKL